MPRWLKSRLGTSVVAGTLAIGVVGGLAFAVAGPIMSSSVSSNTPSASAGLQAAGGSKGSGACTRSAAGASNSSAANSATACATGRAGVLRKLLGRTEHASLIVKGKGGTWVTLTLDRGTIKSISSTSITIVRPDGVSVTAPITSSTKFRRATESSLTAGESVIVVQQDGSTRSVIALTGKGSGSTGAATGVSGNATA